MSFSWGASRHTVRAGGPAPRRADVARRLSDTAVTISADPPAHERQRVAAELAPMVEVWQRLLAQHVPDRAGRCRTCTKGGTGLPTTPWPCVIHGIADLARRSHDEERTRATT